MQLNSPPVASLTSRVRRSYAKYKSGKQTSVQTTTLSCAFSQVPSESTAIDCWWHDRTIITRNYCHTWTQSCKPFRSHNFCGVAWLWEVGISGLELHLFDCVGMWNSCKLKRTCTHVNPHILTCNSCVHVFCFAASWWMARSGLPWFLWQICLITSGHGPNTCATAHPFEPNAITPHASVHAASFCKPTSTHCMCRVLKCTHSKHIL